MTTNRMLRPGLLVSLSSRISGGVVYDRKDLDAEKAAVVASEKAEVTRWETTKVIDDPEEYAAAVVIRGKVRNLVASICAKSDFGLLCPSSREFDLVRAIEEARKIADEHNAKARRSFVSLYVITGRIAADDAEAVRAVASEVRGLVSEMQAGIDAADPERIRKAANAAKSLGAMLTDDAAAKVEGAIEEARKAAREIVKRVEKSGEVAAKVIAEVDRKALREASAAFVEMEGAATVAAPAVEAGAVDFAEAPAAVVAPVVAPKAPAAVGEIEF